MPCVARSLAPRECVAGDCVAAAVANLSIVANVELVDEDVVAAGLRREEAEALFAVEPLDDARVRAAALVVRHLLFAVIDECAGSHATQLRVWPPN